MLKRIFYYIFCIVHIFISAYLLPIFFIIAFNFSKGIQNNEDGFFMIPIGFVLIVFTLFIDVLLIIKAFKMNKDSVCSKVIIVAVLAVIIAIAVVLTYQTWSEFFRCFAFYKGINLSPQR